MPEVGDTHLAQWPAEHADHPQIRKWAGKTLMKMRNHLAKANAVQDTVKNQGDGKN